MLRTREHEVREIMDRRQGLPDPRSTTNRQHLLVAALVISVLAVLAGADGPVTITSWAKLNHDWLKRYLHLPCGIPSRDMFGRLLEVLRPAAFQQCFSAWLKSLLLRSEERSGRSRVVIDGKALRGWHDHSRGLGPLRLVSAWATERGITLGQLATAGKSREITAIPRLLKQINLEGSIVTIDAARCRKNIVKQIVAGGGDCVLALNRSHRTFHRNVEAFIADNSVDDFARVDVSRWEEEETDHGRKEHRFYHQLDLPENLAGRTTWRKLKTIGYVLRMTEVNSKEQIEVRHYISSLKRRAKTFARAVRNHGSVESALHWSVDVTPCEDESRIRGRHVAENIAGMQRMALSLPKQHPGKESPAIKLRMGGRMP